MRGTWSVREALAWARSKLADQESDEARLDAEVLLAHVLGWPRARLYAHPQRCLMARQQTLYQRLIERRMTYEPVAYLTGHKEFYGLDFFVDRRVLVPRPETELLVEQAIAVVEECAWRAGQAILADVGTGSGAIAVSLAVHLPGVAIYAIDVSPEALAVAAENCRRYGVEGRVRLLAGDLLEPLPEPVDVIVANLPYVSHAEYERLPPEVADYEPRPALDGGSQGLDTIERLLTSAVWHLNPGGVILLEIGATQGQAVTALAQRHWPHAAVELRQDYAGLDRMVTVRTGETR